MPPTIRETDAIAIKRMVSVLLGVELRLNDVLGIPDVEIILFFGTQMVPVSQHRRRFLPGDFYGVLRKRPSTKYRPAR